MTSELVQLGELRSARARLDEQELTLIDRARYQGATWAQIAEALGLASRQAAEQRRQRLAAAAQARRLAADAAPVAAVRMALGELHRWIGADRRWDSRFARAVLVRRTVATALEAPPGPLHSLAAHVVADLADVDPRRLPPPVRAAAAALETALSTGY